MTVKIGLLGGTFDPVHTGHVQLAELAMAEQGLTKVLFIPAAAPPHKPEVMISAYDHRLAMLELALADRPDFAICQAERILPRPSYTIDTICYLQTILAKDASLYFIIGLDAFLDITSWKAYEELLARVHLLVASRAEGGGRGQLTDLAASLHYTSGAGLWRAEREHLQDIIFLRGCPSAISSSAIRAVLREGKEMEAGLNDDVRRYIDQHHLYR